MLSGSFKKGTTKGFHLMKIEIRNKDVFDFFNDKQTLLSSSVKRLEFENRNEGLVIRINFLLQYPKGKLIAIEFNEIINYSLNLSDSTDFYNVESVKFFENDSSFYISLDPYDENETISDKDNDFILAQKILLVTEG